MSLDVAQILDELARDRGEGAGVSTTTMNLVALVDDPNLCEWIVERTGEIARRHPSRVVVLDAAHEAGTHSVHSSMREIEHTLMTGSQQITIGVSGMQAPELFSVAHALVVPNVETVLYWAGAHVAGDERLGRLSEIADCLVVDTSRSDSTAGTLRELASFVEAHESIAVHDLAYMRLLSWQDMIAQFFDDPELASEIGTISRIDIAAGSDSEALYIVGWLASRLGWQPHTSDAFCDGAGAEIHFTIAREGDPRRVHRIALESGDSTFTAALEPGTADLAALTVSGKFARPERCVPLHHIDIVALIERAILSPRRDDVFRSSLQMARAVLERRSNRPDEA